MLDMLLQSIQYDEQSPSGIVWKLNYHRSKIGKPAGYLDKSTGRWILNFKGKVYKVHRLVWALHHGAIPEGYVLDHVNRIPSDNNINNLRLATLSQNAINSATPKRDLPRCIYHHRTGGYDVQVGAGGKVYRYFSMCLDDAIQWRDKVRAEVHAAFTTDAVVNTEV